ncbi:flagellar assembly peptidoglycan hydrolase FlgJ [Thiobacter aerophilum]|uniref:Peptidoglycan hydrolase FlgJ n=1 Tax=Thiobacter aerophilum TaxID=3121275 RepID=A0ABV0EIB8_9BURK
MSGAAALALDPRTLAGLHHAAKADGPGSLAAVAREFEGLFLGILLKSMRATAPQGGPFDSDTTRLYRELADQQLAHSLATSGRGMGIADMLLAQVQGAPSANGSQDRTPLPLARKTKPIDLERTPSALPLKTRMPGSDMMPLAGMPVAPTTTPGPKAFVSAVWDHAVAAARALGVPPAFLVAQAALESGWGAREIRLPDGRPSHNLFGIKAGSEWRGATVDIPTTEYVNGKAQSKLARFRAYDSYGEAFADYARLLGRSERFRAARQVTDFTAFAQALQQAGYATDPAYAAKLTRVMASATFREAMAA